MGYSTPAAVAGKYRTHTHTDGLPTVIIYTFRRTPEGMVQDTLQVKTAYPPSVGDFVQGYDGQYSRVKTIERSYQDQSPPVIYATCEMPKSGSLNC